MGSFADPALAGHADKALGERLGASPARRIFDNAKVSDHNAIIPTGVAPKDLDEAQQKIFDLVSRRFIAVFYPAAQFEVTTRLTRVEGEVFKTDGRVIKDPGWMAVYGREATAGDGGEADLVAIAQGETARAEEVEVRQSDTKPPAALQRGHAAGDDGRRGQARRGRGTARRHEREGSRHAGHARGHHRRA